MALNPVAYTERIVKSFLRYVTCVPLVPLAAAAGEVVIENGEFTDKRPGEAIRDFIRG